MISARKLVPATMVLLLVAGCGPPLPPSKPLSELNAQEMRGYHVYQAECARCHYANNVHSLHGPGLQGLFKLKYLPSGAPANDDRVTDVIMNGHGVMPAFGNKIDQQQLNDLMAYLHTL
ncbi:MAG TPA: cytochrome c [Acidobacteriaceae bacterium]|nr:cytochrome c [Acidobacteriaceae bacterium]